MTKSPNAIKQIQEINVAGRQQQQFFEWLNVKNLEQATLQLDWNAASSDEFISKAMTRKMPKLPKTPDRRQKETSL
jgi:hypothetical protein